VNWSEYRVTYLDDRRDQVYHATVLATGADHARLRLGIPRVKVVSVRVWRDGKWDDVELEF
jgi:hypothetical protein